MTGKFLDPYASIQGIVSTAIAVTVFLGASLAAAATRYVSPDGHDASPGTKEAPLRTVQEALNRAGPADTVSIKAGTYDLSGYARIIDYPLTLVGENCDTTVLTHGGTLTFTKSLTIENLTFRGYRSTVLKPAPGQGQKVDGLIVRNCVFEHLASALNTGKDAKGTITNVELSNCRFQNLRGAGVAAIAITSGLISRVQITGNSFRNLQSTVKGCSAVVVGSNATRSTTADILIAENEMDTIVGPTVVVDGAGPEVHGILAYGTHLKILKNTVRNLNPGTDHEAIYMKASHSVIADNVVEDCGSGSGGADISSKGGEESQGNVIRGNRILGNQPGRGMLINGGTVIQGNHICKPNGSNGIDVYAYGKPVTITGNYVETKSGSAIRLDGGKDTLIADNVAISYEGATIKTHSSTGTTTRENREGRTRAGTTPAGGSFPAPRP